MIGERMEKRGNSEKKHGNRCAERTIEKKLHTTRKKTPDYCIIYIFGEHCATRILSIKKKIYKKAGKLINEQRGKTYAQVTYV